MKKDNWKYTQKDLIQWSQRMMNEAKNNIERKIIINHPEIITEVVSEYFNDMNQYAFMELRTRIKEEIKDNEDDEDYQPDFSFKAMKERIVDLEYEYATINGLDYLGICPERQVDYLAESASCWYQENYTFTGYKVKPVSEEYCSEPADIDPMALFRD